MMDTKKLVTILTVLAVILFFGGMILMSPMMGGGATLPVSETPTAIVAATATAKQPPDTSSTGKLPFEGITSADADSQFGQIDVEYPLRFTPGSSDVLRALIAMPPEMASLNPIAFERIPVPTDAPPIIGETTSYQTTILVADTMRLELSSPTIAVDTLTAPTQAVDTTGDGDSTMWAWSLVAPETAGLHVLVLKTFLGDNPNPVWLRSFQVEVTELKTDSPFWDRPGGTALIGAITSIIGALIGLLGVLIGKGIIKLKVDAAESKVRK